MKISRGFIAAVAALAIIALFVWNRIERTNDSLTTTDEGARVWMLTHPQHQAVVAFPSNAPVVPAKLQPVPGNLTKRPSEFTDEERQEFTNLFLTKLKPAAEKWASIYTNRVPFDLDDLTADKFVSQLGRNRTNHRAYTFVMGDITFVIQEFHGDTYVNYLASRRGMGAMNTLPKLAGPADLSMPVTREQVLDLVEADSGKRFPPNEVSLTPTGQSGSLMGGATLEVGKDASNPEFAHVTTKETSFSLTFGPDGKLVYYERDP